MLCLPCPLPHSGASLPEGQGLTGWGPIGGPGEGGGRMKTLCYLMSVPAGEGSQEKKKGVAWRVLFYLLFPDFFCI